MHLATARNSSIKELSLNSFFCLRYIPGAVAIYGPFLLMVLYTLFFVSCNHCKWTAFYLLPCGPGLWLAEIFLHNTLPDWAIFCIAFVISGGLLLLIGWLPLDSKRSRLTLFAVVFS